MLIKELTYLQMSSWSGFCLYVAAGVFIQDEVTVKSRSQSKNNVDFLLSAMKAMGKNHIITQHFIAQLELDLEASGITQGRPGEMAGFNRIGFASVFQGILPDQNYNNRDGSDQSSCSWMTSTLAKRLAIAAKDASERRSRESRDTQSLNKSTSGSSPDDSSGSASKNGDRASHSSEHGSRRHRDPYIARTMANIGAAQLDLQSRFFATTFNLPIPSTSTTVPDPGSIYSTVMDVTNDNEFMNANISGEYPYRVPAGGTSQNRGTERPQGMFQQGSTLYDLNPNWQPVQPIFPNMSDFSDISPQIGDEDLAAIFEQPNWPPNNPT